MNRDMYLGWGSYTGLSIVIENFREKLRKRKFVLVEHNISGYVNSIKCMQALITFM